MAHQPQEARTLPLELLERRQVLQRDDDRNELLPVPGMDRRQVEQRPHAPTVRHRQLDLLGPHRRGVLEHAGQRHVRERALEVEIADDDKATVTLEVSPNPVDEGSAVTVTARLDKALPGAVVIPLALSKGTAEDGDYGALTSVRVAAGRRSATGTITTVRDEDEEDKTFTVALGSPLPSSVLAGDPSEVEVTIADDGPLRAELTSSTLRPAEGRSARLTATLNHPAPAGGVRVRFYADGTGDNPAYPLSDFRLAPTGESQHTTAWIGIDEGERSAVGWLRVVDDDIPEDDETLAAWLDGDWTTESPKLELTIPANDGGGGEGSAAWIDAEPNPVTEGRDVEVRVWLTKALEADATIPLTVRRGSSEAGDHGTLDEVVIAAGELVGRGTISTIRDDDADDETFTVRLGRLPSGVRAGTASSVEIVIDDQGAGAPAAVSLEAAPNPVPEGESVTVTATLDKALTSSVRIPVTVERGTSESGDHGSLSSIRIASGDTEGTGRITTSVDDDIDDETITVKLRANLPTGVMGGQPLGGRGDDRRPGRGRVRAGEEPAGHRGRRPVERERADEPRRKGEQGIGRHVLVGIAQPVVPVLDDRLQGEGPGGHQVREVQAEGGLGFHDPGGGRPRRGERGREPGRPGGPQHGRVDRGLPQRRPGQEVLGHVLDPVGVDGRRADRDGARHRRRAEPGGRGGRALRRAEPRRRQARSARPAR